MSSVKSVLVPRLIDGVVVMTMPEDENWNSRLCVSEQGNGRRTVTWNIGVSPMKLKDFIMVNHKLAQEPVCYAYTT